MNNKMVQEIIANSIYFSREVILEKNSQTYLVINLKRWNHFRDIIIAIIGSSNLKKIQHFSKHKNVVIISSNQLRFDYSSTLYKTVLPLITTEEKMWNIEKTFLQKN